MALATTPSGRPAALVDAAPGHNPIHGILAWEEAEILALHEEWGDIDLSHRKLAHRGSYQQRVWVSPSTVDRVLARQRARPARRSPPRPDAEDPLARLV